MNRYQLYLNVICHPFKKLCKIDFLQPDNSVAFSLDNNYQKSIQSRYDSRAFIQSGSLNVALQNGQRRTATITLSNLDSAFDYSVNKIWYGKRVRLSMGCVLPDGTDFYIPQGVFYFKNPKNTFLPNLKEISYSLVDKWSYLDGSLFGLLPYSYEVFPDTNIFEAMQSILRWSIFDLTSETSDPLKMLDNIPPVFTDYYNNLPDLEYVYTPPGATNTVTKVVKSNETAFTTRVEMGRPASELLLGLNQNIVGLIGYDPTGALRVEPSQEDVLDSEKPVLWNFSPKNSLLLGYTDASQPTSVFNDVIIAGQGLNDEIVWGRATNYDPLSDTNVNLIGQKTYKDTKSDFWNKQQCVDYAKWILKRKTILQKSVSISSSQMFHLLENRLISIQRTDKLGAPVEKHLIQSFSIPIGETGNMTINAISVNDLPNLSTTLSNS